MLVYSLYLHIPFCIHRCSYCDFNTYTGIDQLIPDYVEGLCREADWLAASAGTSLPVHTIFFGGGTPSILPTRYLRKILEGLAGNFNLLPGIEITLEANPGTVSPEYLSALMEIGVNRLSFGMQSANEAELRLLERQHDTSDVIHAVSWARQAGFTNINIDLIYGLPGQSLVSWMRSLEMALALQPDHFSLYSLTLEQGTPMQSWVARGLLEDSDPDLAAEMYEMAAVRLERAEFSQYEISNWARKIEDGTVMACQHNLQYWRNRPYLGLGAGAHGFAGKLRVANVLSPADYIQHLLPVEDQNTTHAMPFPLSPATAESQTIDPTAEMGETMMMGLRLTCEGVSAVDFHNRFGVRLAEVYAPQIDRLLDLRLLEWVEGNVLRLTPRGRLLGNRVFMEFI